MNFIGGAGRAQEAAFGLHENCHVNNPIHELLCSTLRGEEPVWPGLDPEAVLTLARVHGVVSLLHGSIDHWPAEARDGVHVTARAEAMWELRHQDLLSRTLHALQAADSAAIILKGTALAYSHYAEPWQRSRADTDILLPPGMQRVASQVLESLGYREVIAAPSGQSTFLMEAGDGTRHTLDVHWQINNSPLLAKLFRFEELLQRACALPALGRAALAPCTVDSLLIACMHRATHATNPYFVDGVAHLEADRLIWLYDLHLLAGKLTAAQWEECTLLARRKGLAAACHQGLRYARACFGTVIPPSADSQLAAVQGERPAAYLRSGPLRQQWMDWAALADWGARARWLRDLFLPPERYMRAKYGADGHLGGLYLRRAVTGLIRQLGRSRKS